jgi:hypothetical protein
VQRQVLLNTAALSHAIVTNVLVCTHYNARTVHVLRISEVLVYLLVVLISLILLLLLPPRHEFIPTLSHRTGSSVFICRVDTRCDVHALIEFREYRLNLAVIFAAQIYLVEVIKVLGGLLVDHVRLLVY